jgi:CDP-glycerol glycerophosphotransferase
MPIYNVGPYLSDCLTSIMSQSFVNIEVIGVDGASTDNSVEILKGKSTEDPRLRVVLLEEQVGPGRARNAGLERARGEYIWFVDADDIVASGSLEVIADRLARVNPDVLYVDFDHLSLKGELKPGPGRDLLAAAPDGCFRLVDQPWLADLTMASWARIVRREFYLSTGVAFARGIHEDIPVSCAMLLSACQISALSRVCYHYRKRDGSFMSETTRKHFDIFDSYRNVLDLVEKLAANGDPRMNSRVRVALFERAIWHYTTILDTGGMGIGRVGSGGLIRRRERCEFFEEICQDFAQYKPPDYCSDSHSRWSARGVKFRLIEKNVYWLYALLEPFNKIRMSMFRLVRR